MHIFFSLSEIHKGIVIIFLKSLCLGCFHSVNMTGNQPCAQFWGWGYKDPCIYFFNFVFGYWYLFQLHYDLSYILTKYRDDINHWNYMYVNVYLTCFKTFFLFIPLDMSEKSCVQNCLWGGEISRIYFLLYVCFKILYFEVLGPLLLGLLFGVRLARNIIWKGCHYC